MKRSGLQSNMSCKHSSKLNNTLCIIFIGDFLTFRPFLSRRKTFLGTIKHKLPILGSGGSISNTYCSTFFIQIPITSNALIFLYTVGVLSVYGWQL